MRGLATLLLTACFLLSGCASQQPDAADGERGLPEGGAGPSQGSDQGAASGAPPGGGEPAAAEPPADVVFEGSLMGLGAGGVLPVAPPIPQCAVPERQCAEHVVAVPAGGWMVTFTLVGHNGAVTDQGVPGETDYDLAVAGVGDSTNPGGQSDVVKGKLAPGDYTAEVYAWHDVDGSYTLTVSFS